MAAAADEDVDMIWRGDPHRTIASELLPVYRVSAPVSQSLYTVEALKMLFDFSKISGLEDGLLGIRPHPGIRKLPPLPYIYIADTFEGRVINGRNLYDLIQSIRTTPYIQRFLPPATLSSVGKEQPPVILFTLYHSGMQTFTKIHKTAGIAGYDYERKPVPANTTIIQFTKSFTMGFFTTFANFLLRAIKTETMNDAFYDFLMNPTRAKFKSNIADLGMLDVSFVADIPAVSGLHSYRDGDTYPELYCTLGPYAGSNENNITSVPGIYDLSEIIESLLVPSSIGIHSKAELNTIMGSETWGDAVFKKLRLSSTARYIEKLKRIKSAVYEEKDGYLHEGPVLYDDSIPPHRLTTFPELVSATTAGLHFSFSDMVTALRGDSRIHPDRRIIIFNMGCKVSLSNIPEEVQGRLRAESVSRQRGGKLNRRGAITTAKKHNKQKNRKEKHMQSITKTLNNRRHKYNKHNRKTRKQSRAHHHRHRHRRCSHPRK